MKLNEVIIIVKRLYREYIKKYLGKIFIAIFLSVLVAGSTSAIAWLLDPAVKKIFIEQDKTFAVFIPVLVILAFMGKGISLYYARSIVIVLGNRIKQTLQNKMTDNILLSDSQTIESKHSGKYISTFLYDVGMIQELVSTGVLNIIKDSWPMLPIFSLMQDIGSIDDNEMFRAFNMGIGMTIVVDRHSKEQVFDALSDLTTPYEIGSVCSGSCEVTIV